MELRSERLLLRRPLASDLEAMFAIMSDPQAMRYWSTLPHADREVTRRWLDKMLERIANGGEDFIMVLDGEAIGTVGAGRLPDFGFMLRRDFWGRGLATEASRAFIGYAFADTAATHLDADVDPRNAASLSVLGKLGFIETGRAQNTFLLGDEWCHSVYLRLDRPEVS